MTPRIMIVSMMTHRIMKLRITMLTKMALRIKKFRTMKFSIMTHRIIKLRTTMFIKMTLRIKKLIIKTLVECCIMALSMATLNLATLSIIKVCKQAQY